MLVRCMIGLILLLAAVVGWRIPAAATRRLVGSLADSHNNDQLSDSKYLNKCNSVFVAGGKNGVGYHVIKALSSRGISVHTLLHKLESLRLLRDLPGVKIIQGDARNPDDVQRCMDGCGAAITALCSGSSPGKEDRIDYVGNSNVIEQAGILGVERIILVSSVGCGPTKNALTSSMYGDLREKLIAMDKAERDLKLYTNLDWTIVRPGGLKNDEEPSERAILTENITATGFIRRADVANLIVKLLSANMGIHKEFSAIDPSLSIGETANYVPFEFTS